MEKIKRLNFSGIPGQKEVISRLIRSVSEEKVSHAQLFAGPEGCGSLALALAYARYIQCENRSETDSCGVCKSCVKHEKMIHPDLHFVFPVVKGKNEEPISDTYLDKWRELLAKSSFITLNDWLDAMEVGNAQGMIFASEASEIIRKLSLKAFESEFKIMIIWLPEKMNPSTSNKLLKLIEEPPEKTLFLLVSEDVNQIIPTILSRCQLVKIPGFSDNEIKDFLCSRFGIDEEKASEVARISTGNICRATEELKNEENTHVNLERFKNLMRFAWKRDIISVINWSEDIAAAGRESQKDFLSFCLRLIRENLMITLGQKQNNLVFLSGEEAEFSGKFHPFINYDNIFSLRDEFSLAYSHVEANGNGKIIFLDLGLRVTKLIR